MHPDVCRYISEVFSEGRLRSRFDLSRIQLHAPDPFWHGPPFRPGPHRGNRSDSIEEAAAVASLVDRLTSAGSSWTDRHGETHPLTRKDILVTAFYRRLRNRIPGLCYRVAPPPVGEPDPRQI